MTLRSYTLFSLYYYLRFFELLWWHFVQFFTLFINIECRNSSMLPWCNGYVVYIDVIPSRWNHFWGFLSHTVIIRCFFDIRFDGLWPFEHFLLRGKRVLILGLYECFYRILIEWMVVRLEAANRMIRQLVIVIIWAVCCTFILIDVGWIADDDSWPSSIDGVATPPVQLLIPSIESRRVHLEYLLVSRTALFFFVRVCFYGLLKISREIAPWTYHYPCSQRITVSRLDD